MTLDIVAHPITVQPMDVDYIACKVPTFSFGRLENSDSRLGMEMQPTGEAVCFGVTLYGAFSKVRRSGRPCSCESSGCSSMWATSSL